MKQDITDHVLGDEPAVELPVDDDSAVGSVKVTEGPTVLPTTPRQVPNVKLSQKVGGVYLIVQTPQIKHLANRETKVLSPTRHSHTPDLRPDFWTSNVGPVDLSGWRGYRSFQKLGTKYRECGLKYFWGSFLKNIAQSDLEMAFTKPDRVGKAGVWIAAHSR